MPYGKLIAIEGIDGSGKDTQARLLLARLRKEGHKATLISFPRYKKKSGSLVKEYLSGVYGSPQEVGPYRAAIFYAADRYAASHQIHDLLNKGYVVIADRYIGSNLAHQGGKIRNKTRRKRFYKWLLNLEYGIFKIPRPHLNILLDMPPQFARYLIAKRINSGGRIKNDIHERRRRYILHAYKCYQEIGKLYPYDFKIISCAENSKLLTKGQVHAKVWSIMRRLV